MSGLTWGISVKSGERLATVFCPLCREMIQRDLPLGRAGVVANTTEHACTFNHDCNGNKTRPYQEEK